MKKLLLLFTFVFFLFTFSFSQEYSWQDISDNIPNFPYDTVYNNYDDTIVALLTDVSFINDNEGWITTWHPFNDSAAILHTTDGGETFEVQITQFSCNAIHMLNENEGYAGGRSGFVYRTVDGGENWNFHGTAVSNITDISFPPNGDKGYCCGINGNIWSIDNAGVTTMTNNINGDLSSISFPINSEEGWVCGGSVIVTYFNGTWGGAANGYPSGGYYAIHMVDNDEGWAVGTKIIYTEDGVNWYDQGLVLTETLLAVYFLTNQKGWAVGSNGTILQTNNGGADWNVEGIGLSSSILRGVHFTSPVNGYVVGNGKTLLKYGELTVVEEEAEELKFELYPNPAISVISLQSAVFSQELATIEITDMQGKKLFEKHLQAGNETVEVDVSNLASGVYFCRLTSENKSATQKLIIQK